MEDEFRTLEGRDSKGLARISFFTGKGEDKCLLSKGFKGVDHVVSYPQRNGSKRMEIN